MCFGERTQRQRLAQRQDRPGLVEQAAHQRRADVPRVKDEIDGPRLADELCGGRNAIDRQPGAPGPRPQDAIIQEARGSIGVLAELDQQEAVRIRSSFCGRTSGGSRQMGEQRIGSRVGPMHGQKKAAAPHEAAASLSTFRPVSEPDTAAQEDEPAQWHRRSAGTCCRCPWYRRSE